MDKNEEYSADLLLAFIGSVGLTKECEEFCKMKTAESLKKAKAEPIGDRCFKWKGHYTKYCYKMSGENFYGSTAFNKNAVSTYRSRSTTQAAPRRSSTSFPRARNSYPCAKWKNSATSRSTKSWND